MVNLNPDNIAAAFKKYNYKFFVEGDYNLNIFGIRMNNNLDQFTDTRVVFYKVNGAWVIWQTNCTTKPGLFSLLHPENNEGTSTLKEGQYLSNWVIGWHKGIAETSHRALVQKADGYGLPVYRDFEHDGQIRFDLAHLKDDGRGINLHGTYNYGGSVAPPKVYNWSMGCQVIAIENSQMEFMDLCDKAAPLHGNSFSYTLFNALDFI